MSSEEGWIADARRFGAIAPGQFRVVVMESDGRVSHHDFADLAAAKQYAIDAASEAEELPSPQARVLNERFEVVYRGHHYGAQPPA